MIFGNEVDLVPGQAQGFHDGFGRFAGDRRIQFQGDDAVIDGLEYLAGGDRCRQCGVESSSLRIAGSGKSCDQFRQMVRINGREKILVTLNARLEMSENPTQGREVIRQPFLDFVSRI